MNRPVTRGDCEAGERPCPWSSCRYHLGDAAADSCALDVADRGERTHEQIASLLGVTRQRVQQLEVQALAKVARRLELVRPLSAKRSPTCVVEAGAGSEQFAHSCAAAGDNTDPASTPAAALGGAA